MPSDSLGVLLRLRRHAVSVARTELAVSLAAATSSAERAAAVHATLLEETQAAPPALLHAWLPHALDQRDRAGQAVRRSEQEVASARDVLAASRAAELVVETLRDERDALRRRAALRREQRVLDDAAIRSPR